MGIRDDEINRIKKYATYILLFSPSLSYSALLTTCHFYSEDLSECFKPSLVTTL